VTALGFFIAAFWQGSPVVVISGFCLAAGGAYSGLATFWSVPPLFLGGTAAAGAFALINSVGNLSGSLGPGLMGLLLKLTGDYKAGLWMCVAVPILSALSMMVLSKSVTRAPR
jgi:ACS family tartrate transporter-like MFS transporter